MLSPSVKDQQSQESDSPVTSRPVLKDMNTSGSQKVRILNNVVCCAYATLSNNFFKLNFDENKFRLK